MPLHHLEHVLIQVKDLEATTRWYEDVLGMRRGPHPDFKFPVEWLYIGATDVLHLTTGGSQVTANRMAYLGQQSQALEGTGVIDHIAFRATGLKAMLAELTSRGIDYKTRQVDGQGLFQIFLFDPNGVKVELNYENAEAQGIAPELLASQLS